MESAAVVGQLASGVEAPWRKLTGAGMPSPWRCVDHTAIPAPLQLGLQIEQPVDTMKLMHVALEQAGAIVGSFDDLALAIALEDLGQTPARRLQDGELAHRPPSSSTMVGKVGDNGGMAVGSVSSQLHNRPPDHAGTASQSGDCLHHLYR